MILINLKGGLGNQMFQYACGRALALRNGGGGNGNDLRIVAEGLERANSVGDIYRPFSLQNFTIVGEVVPSSSISVWQKIKRKILQKIFRQFYVGFVPNVLEQKGAVFLDGFFQSEKYFVDFADIIRAELTLKSELGADALRAAELIKNDRHAVSLHVRRGDYAKHKDFGGIADVAYYERALKEMIGRVADAHFYIFSDDIAWCKDNLPLDDCSVTFVSLPSMRDYEELTLMSYCRHHIISNSTFSWWGAWLNPSPTKIVIAPTSWAHRKINDDFRDIIPDTWNRI